MADRKVEVDIVLNDKTAAGAASASRTVGKLGDDIDKKTKESGEKAGKNFGEKIGQGVKNAGAKIGETFAKLGVKAGGMFGDGISSAITNASPQIQGAIGGVLAAIAVVVGPMLGAILAGAVVGGAAGTGIVGGVILAARDSRIQGAAKSLGERVMSALNQQGGVFLEPLLRSLNQVSERFTKLQPLIGRLFAAAARYVEPLTEALLDAGEILLTSIVGATERAGPVLRSFGDGLVKVAEAVGYVIDEFSKLESESSSAISAFFSFWAFGIKVMGTFVTVLAKVWGWVSTLGGLLGDDGAKVEELGLDAASTTTALGGLNIALDDSAASAGKTAEQMSLAAQGVKSLTEVAIEADQAQINLNRILKEVSETREKGSKITDNERQALIDLQGAISQQIEAYAQTGVSSDEVNRKANELRDAFIAQARQMGMNQKQAEELANKYGLIPRKVDSSLTLTGAAEAARELERVAARAGSIDRQIDIAIRVTGSQASRRAIQAALAKQSLSADYIGSFGQGAASFAERNGFARLAGAAPRVTPTNVRLTSRVRVDLNGRALAPEMVSVSESVYDEREWRGKVGKR